MHAQKASEVYEGKLIAFEGIDRAGKSSVLQHLAKSLSDCNVPVHTMGEFQSPIKSTLREMLRRGGSPFLKTFLFATDRAWTYEATCVPALRRGDLVLWDRYVDSAIAYRAVELSKASSLIDLDFVKAINYPFIRPDLTIYIDIPVDVSSQRALAEGVTEPYNQEFLEAVRTEYLDIVETDRYVTIDGNKPMDLVTTDVDRIIRQHFKELFS